MKISMSTEYYDEVIHQKRRTTFLEIAIQQYKKDYPSKMDYKGDLYPRDIIKILMMYQIRIFVLFDLFFHRKNFMRPLVFQRTVKKLYKTRPRKVVELCEYYGVVCKPAPNNLAFVEVKTEALQRRGRKFKARKHFIYV